MNFCFLIKTKNTTFDHTYTRYKKKYIEIYQNTAPYISNKKIYIRRYTIYIIYEIRKCRLCFRRVDLFRSYMSARSVEAGNIMACRISRSKVSLHGRDCPACGQTCIRRVGGGGLLRKSIYLLEEPT